jgi:hypothetical protein
MARSSPPPFAHHGLDVTLGIIGRAYGVRPSDLVRFGGDFLEAVWFDESIALATMKRYPNPAFGKREKSEDDDYDEAREWARRKYGERKE